MLCPTGTPVQSGVREAPRVLVGYGTQPGPGTAEAMERMHSCAGQSVTFDRKTINGSSEHGTGRPRCPKHTAVEFGAGEVRSGANGRAARGYRWWLRPGPRRSPTSCACCRCICGGMTRSTSQWCCSPTVHASTCVIHQHQHQRQRQHQHQHHALLLTSRLRVGDYPEAPASLASYS